MKFTDTPGAMKFYGPKSFLAHCMSIKGVHHHTHPIDSTSVLVCKSLLRKHYIFIPIPCATAPSSVYKTGNHVSHF